jgi:hypothetical protein
MLNKNYCIIGPMRSGTSLLFRMVRDFSCDFDSKLNDEFFNVLLPQFGIYDNGNELVNDTKPYLPYSEEISYRLDLLKKYNYQYTIKIVADQLTDTLIDSMCQNYNIILIDRVNKYEQYLSLLIAEYSNVWNRGRVFKEDLEPFNASITIADDYFKFEKKWIEDKQKILNYTTPIFLSYEDFVNNPVEHLKENNINTREFSKFYKPLFKLRSKDEKEYLIKNISEIKNIFEENKAIWKSM